MNNESIHNIEELNKAIEVSTNETNHLLEELNELETARKGGALSSPEEYEKEKANIEQYLLKEQEKVAKLSSVLENYNRIMEIYDILRTTRKQDDFNTLLNELNGLLETLPVEMKEELQQTHILNKKRNRIIEIKATSIDEVKQLLDASLKETDHLHEEMNALDEATRTDNLHPNNYYVKEKEIIDFYLEKEEEKQSIYKDIIDSYNKLIELYEKSTTIQDELEYQELIKETNKLKDILPPDIRRSIEAKYVYSGELNRIIKISAESKEEVEKLIEQSQKEVEHLHKEMEALEESVRTDKLYPNSYYIKGKANIEKYLKIEEAKLLLYSNILEEMNKVIDSTIPVSEIVRESDTSDQVLLDAIQDEIDKQEEEKQEQQKDIQEIEEKIKTKIKDNAEKMNIYEDKFNKEINNFKANDLEENVNDFEEKEEKHLDELNNINKDFKEVKIEDNNIKDLEEVISEKDNSLEFNNDEQEELLRQIEEHTENRRRIAKQIQDTYNKIKEFRLNNMLGTVEELNNFESLLGPDGPLARLEKELQEEDKIINELKAKANLPKEEKESQPVEVKIEEPENDLQKQLQEHIEKRNQLAKQLQDTYNFITNAKKETILSTDEQLNNYYALFGPNGPLARLEKEINQEDEIISQLRERLNLPEEEKEVQPEPIKVKTEDNNEDLQRQLQEHIEKKDRLIQQIQETYNKIRDFKQNNLLGTVEELNDFESLFGPDGPLARLEEELRQEEEIIKGLKEKLNIKDDEPKKPEPIIPEVQPQPKEPKLRKPKPEDLEPKEPEPKKPEPIVPKPEGPTGIAPQPKQPQPKQPQPKGPETKDPEPVDYKPKRRSLNTILADIIMDPETKKPVNVTRKQRKRCENSQISVSKRFVSQISNKNTLYNLFSIAPAVISLPISVIQKLSGKILTTRKTKKNMKIIRDNLNKLSVSDLAVLEREYKGNTAISERGMIGVDGLIQERIERFRYERIELKRAAMKALYDKVLTDYTRFRTTNDLLRSINERRISDAELQRLMEENHAQTRNHLTRILKERCDRCIKGKASEIKQIRDLRTEIENEYSGGLHGHEEDFRAKSTKMNEVGKRFAKDRSTADTYEFTRILGQLQDAEMQAIDNNNDMEAMRLFMAIEKKQVMGTEQHRSLLGWRETGLTNYQPIPESLDYRQDPFVRNLLTTISIAGLTVGAIHEIQNRIAQANAQANAASAQDFQNTIYQHNQANNAANAHNMQQGQNVHTYGQELSSRSGDISRGMNAQTGEAIAGRRAVDEYADNDLTGWTMNDHYHSLDDAHHAATQQAADYASQRLADIQSRLATGQITDVQSLREMQALSDNATQQFAQACREALPIARQYAANHPQFQYAGYIENLERFASDPNAINALNEAAIRSVEIGQQLSGITIMPYEELAATLQYLPVEVQSQLFALGSAALLTARTATQAEYLRKQGAEYNEDLTKRIEEIDKKDKERKKKQETDQMLTEEQKSKQAPGYKK